jgi:hypothetical protein
MYVLPELTAFVDLMLHNAPIKNLAIPNTLIRSYINSQLPVIQIILAASNNTMGVTPGCISCTVTLLCHGTQTPEFVQLAKEDNDTTLPFIS